MKLNSKSSLLLFFVVLIIIFIYFPLFISPTIYNKDAFIISDIKNIHSLTQYFQSLGTVSVSDLQPVAHLSIKLDSWLEPYIGFKIYLYSNVLLWLVIVSLAHRIFRLFLLDNNYLYFLTTIFATHPLYVQTVAWMSARKHLLTFLFILLAKKEFFEVLKANQYSWFRYFKISIFYLIAIFAHPMPILWPLWAMLYYYSEKKNLKDPGLKWLLVLVVLGFIFGVLNIHYFNHAYEMGLGARKYSEMNSMGDRFLAFGRYFIQWIFPTVFASFYSPGSILNMVGIPLFGLFIYLSYKLVGRLKAMLVFLLYIMGLVPVTWNMTVIFVSETYFLLSSFMLFILLANKRLVPYFEIKIVQWSAVFLVLLLSVKSFYEAKLFSNYRLYTETSYYREPNCINLQYYATEEFADGNVEKGAELGETLIKEKCFWGNRLNADNLRLLFFRTLVFSKAQRVVEREQEIKKYYYKGLYFKLGFSVFKLRNGKSEDAFNTIHEIFEEKKDLILPANDVFVKYVKDFCAQNPHELCRHFK